MKVNFRTSDFRRQVADAGALTLKNRYFEQNPFLTDDGAALLARPGLRRLTTVGSGPIRGLMSQPGTFNGDLFVASGEAMYRVNPQLESTIIYDGLFPSLQAPVNMAVTAEIGETPEFLFFADGRNLFVYVSNGYARNTLSGTVNDNDVVRIGDVYYRFTSGDVNAGTPEGTSANPYLVKLGVSTTEAFTFLAAAINNNGASGQEYSTEVESNPVAIATNWTSTIMSIRSRVTGAESNTIPTTETGTSISWATPTLANGGQGYVETVQMPDDMGVIDVAVINSYVILIPAQNNGYQGRFYWIEPGETTLNFTNFATAERSPDGIFGVEVFGDQFWLPGQTTTEVWYPTGDPDVPMRRLQGVVFDRGSWEDTARAIHETLVVVDADGGVFLLRGGQPQRVSTPDIEEEIRRAIAFQRKFDYTLGVT